MAQKRSNAKTVEENSADVNSGVVNVYELDLNGLIAFRDKVTNLIEQTRKNEIERLRREMEEKIANSALGSGIEFKLVERSKRGGSVEAKYRNPNDPSQTWSGRGRKPNWLTERLAAGATMDEFVIKNEPAKETEDA